MYIIDFPLWYLKVLNMTTIKFIKYIVLIASSILANEMFSDSSSLAIIKIPIAIKNKSNVQDI